MDESNISCSIVGIISFQLEVNKTLTMHRKAREVAKDVIKITKTYIS